MESKSRLKTFAEGVALIGGVLGIITSIIVIYQFISGNTSIANTLHNSTATIVVDQATLTPAVVFTRSPAKTPPPLATSKTVSTPSTIATAIPASSSNESPFALFTQPAFTPIRYDSFWTWFWWAIAGLVFGGLVTLSICIKSLDFGGFLNVLMFLGMSGAVLEVIFSFASSFLVNHLQLSYTFLMSMGIGGIIPFILGVMFFIYAD